MTKKTPEPAELKGWQAIAQFLGQPVNVAQRWAREGMPVKRKGRYAVAWPDELNAWLGRDAGEPIQIVTQSPDLVSDLKKGLAFVRQQKRGRLKKTKRR